MSCAACSTRVEKAVSKVPGVTSCSVSLLTNSMGVEGSATDQEIIKAVADAGYGASAKDAEGEKNGGANSSAASEEALADHETPILKKRLLYSVGFLLVLMYFSMGHMMWNWPLPAFMDGNHVMMGLVQLYLTVIIMVINQKFFINGFKSLFHGAPNMDTLVALGSFASFGYSSYALFAMTYAEHQGDAEAVMGYMHEFYFESAAMILTLITVVLTLLVCYFIAYGLTMYKFKLQGFLFFLVIATMCVPFEILMLPLYNEVTSLGIINTRAGVILPGLCGASTIFFFKQYMQSLPKELLDAGRIDGCTEYGISVKIMMPITKPAFASMAILCAMGSWNNMLWPMLVFRDTSKFTLQIGLNTLLTPYGNNYNLLIAGSMFGILPILIIYLIFQRYLIDGMTSGAVKG